MDWEPTWPRELDPRLARDQDARPWVCRLDEGDRAELTAFLDADPGYSMFPRGNLEHYSLNATFVRYWGAFIFGRLAAVMMMAGRRAVLYAPAGGPVAALADVAARENVEFTMGRTDLVDALLARCVHHRVSRREEHYLAALPEGRAGVPRVPAPAGAFVRRAMPSDVSALTRLYLRSDGFEDLEEEQVRRTMSSRVRAMRTYVAEAGGALVAACSTSAETPRAAMIGGVWTAPAARNRGYSTAVVAALSRELAEQGRRPYLFYLIDNAPAARVYAKVGFQTIGRWTVAYLRPRGSA